MKPSYKLTVILSIVGLASCSMAGSSHTYTLYRSSTVGEVDRIHVATFDATDGEQYNKENCQLAAGLFQQQPGIKTKFWCEKGRFRK